MVIAARIRDWRFRQPPDGRNSFLAVSAAVFGISVIWTTLWCGSMSAMGEMRMPGGWTMSMAWMRMPGQSWAGAAASFLAMWTLMMVAMMTPAVTPTLWRCREIFGRRTALVALGYFSAWTVLGMLIYPPGVALAALEMRQPALARAVPFATGIVVVIAGLLQFTSWKSNHLACCREAPGGLRPEQLAAPWRAGFRLGVDCIHACAGITAILLVLGVMDLAVMAIATAAITVERLTSNTRRAARLIGVASIVVGLLLVARSLGSR